MHEVPSCIKQKIVPMAENPRSRGRNLHQRCFHWQQSLPAFPRAAGRPIRFWAFPSSGSSREVKSLARKPTSLVIESESFLFYQLRSDKGHVGHPIAIAYSG
jgi:hypothetical protein